MGGPGRKRKPVGGAIAGADQYDGHGASAVRRGQRRPHHNHVCAFSGEAITDLAVMELRVSPEAIGEMELAAVPVRTSPRGGAARPAPGGAPRPRTLLLRFASLTALHQWLIRWDQRWRLVGDEETLELPEGGANLFATVPMDDQANEMENQTNEAESRMNESESGNG